MEMLKNLQRNYDLNIDLKETLSEILQRLEVESYGLVRRNLKLWKKKYIDKINATENISMKTESAIEGYIYNMGLKIEDINIVNFKRQVPTEIGFIDLVGVTENEKYIIEIKITPAKSSVLGQTLSYWQYMKETEGKNYPIIIIAPSYTKQYHYGLKAIRGIKIKSFIYRITKDKIIFQDIDK